MAASLPSEASAGAALTTPASPGGPAGQPSTASGPAGAAAGVSLAGPAADLGGDLPTVRIASFDEAAGIVRYLPAGIMITDPAGSGGPFQVLRAGGQMILSGSVSIAASPEEVETLRSRVTARYGAEARAEPVRPEAFSLEIDIGETPALRRPLSGGPLTDYPVQVALPEPASGTALLVVMRAELRWSGLQGPEGGAFLSFRQESSESLEVGVSTASTTIRSQAAHQQETFVERTDRTAVVPFATTVLASFTFVP